MSVPGFTADSAVYRTKRHYRRTSGSDLAGHRSAIIPQGLCALECSHLCSRECHRNPFSAACEECRWECMTTCDA
ncbi:hypothetical protein [Kitasatospora sp. A2-31]|uniref:hypothetical protein n=1 Tax=Kitasatospora sp. A2-31 TaxID=2916414 RepID=UPI001EED3270|nr:hypothetical protein [Kitasatospora sp. A2-31]MCG6499339.1 hypothetical protein [Kitasatospora sp. A2-31]